MGRDCQALNPHFVGLALGWVLFGLEGMGHVLEGITPTAEADLTPADLTPPLSESEVRAVLDARGRRCTKQRLAVYEQLARSRTHPTADEVYRALKLAIPEISLATVYKALDTLVEAGLASKLTSGDASARYDARHEGHYHLRCLKSGRVEDLETPYVADLLARLDPFLEADLKRRGFRLTGYRLELLGTFVDPQDTDS